MEPDESDGGGPGPLSSPGGRAVRREGASPYRRDARPRPGKKQKTDVSPTSRGILAAIGGRMAAFLGMTPKKAPTDDEEPVELAGAEDADAPDASHREPPRPELPRPELAAFRAAQTAQNTQPAFGALSGPAFATPSGPAFASQPGFAAKAPPTFGSSSFAGPVASGSGPFSASVAAAPKQAPAPSDDWGFNARPEAVPNRGFGTPARTPQLQPPPQLYGVTPANPAAQNPEYTAAIERHKRAAARTKDILEVTEREGRVATPEEMAELQQLAKIKAPNEADFRSPAPGSPFKFIAPPTPKLFTPVRTGVAASPNVARSDKRDGAASAVRRRQDLRYYGVGFSHRNTPRRRPTSNLAGPSVTAGRTQSSLFESMDIQANEPVDFGTGAAADRLLEGPPAPQLPAIANAAASAASEDVSMAIDVRRTPTASRRPSLSSPLSSAAQIIQRVIEETSPPAKLGALPGPASRSLAPNPFMLTENDGPLPPPSAPAKVPPAPVRDLGGLKHAFAATQPSGAVPVPAPPKPAPTFNFAAPQAPAAKPADTPKAAAKPPAFVAPAAPSDGLATPAKGGFTFGTPANGIAASAQPKQIKPPAETKPSEPSNGDAMIVEPAPSVSSRLPSTTAPAERRPEGGFTSMPNGFGAAKENVATSENGTTPLDPLAAAKSKAKSSSATPPASASAFAFQPLPKRPPSRDEDLERIAKRVRSSTNLPSFEFRSQNGNQGVQGGQGGQGGVTQAPTSGFNWGAAGMQKPAAAGWTCSVCMVNNPDSAPKCQACENDKPGAAKATGGTVPATFDFKAAGMQPIVQQGWKCPTCMVSNADSAAKCLSCETDKPRTAAPTGAAAPKAAFDFAAAGMKPQAQAGWTCNVCMVPNSATASKCAACEASRP